MKKTLTFFVLMLLMTSNLTAQHYQFPNPSFSNWTSTSSSSAVPRGWHSFSDADCSLILGCGTAKTNHSDVATDRFGVNQHACRIHSKSVLGTNANGAMTLGKMIIGSMSASSDDNYIKTKRSDNDSTGGKWSMAGRPDSVRLWIKFEMGSASSIATCKMHIHGNVDYKDIPSHNASTAQTGKIANSFCEMVKNHGAVSYNGWERFDFKFTYFNEDNDVVANPTLSNITQATTSFILASFSTNKTVGGGSANDKLYFDDLELVYNKKLASLSIGGTPISASDLATLNNTAFSTAVGDPHTAYNIFNTQGLAVYDYTAPVCADDIPSVTATAESGLISGITYTDATVSNPYTIIVVTHNDGSYYTYKVHFTNILPSPTVTLNNGGSYSACAGETLTMTASGDATSYSWSNGLGGGATVNFTAVNSGNTNITNTYTVTGTASNGCTATATATVTVKPLPNVTISGTPTICSGSPTNLTAGGAFSYEWSYNNATTASISVSTGGTYFVTGTASNGCQNTASVVVSAHENPTVTISGNTFLCSGSTGTLTADGASTYVWDGAGSGSNNPLPITTGGSYSVTGTDAYGCSGSATLTVTLKTTPNVTIGGLAQYCEGSSAQLVASSNIPNTVFTWSDAASTVNDTLVVNTPGTYTVTASLDGCESTASLFVSEATTPAAPSVTPGSNCGAGSVTLAVANSDGDLTYHWFASQSAVNESGSGVSFNTPTLSASATYYVSVQNAAGCSSDRVAVTATINPLPTAPAVSNLSLCGTGDVTLSATPATNLHWYTDNAGENETTTTQHLTETDTFYVATVDGNSCRSVLVPLIVTVNEIPSAPVVTTNPTSPICSNGTVSVTFNATAPAGHTVKWYNSEQQSAGQGAQTTKQVNESTTFYAAIYNNNTQCESEKTPVEIVINTIPAAPTVANTIICDGGDITLSATSAYTVKWYSDEDGNNEIPANQSITSTTTYYAAAIDNNCRSAIVPMTATVSSSYSGITDDKTVCGSYTWEGDTYTTSGTYTKTLHSVDGCDSTVTLNLTINSGVEVSVSDTICDNELPHLWNGMEFTGAGTKTATLHTLDNCDSLVTMTLYVKQASSSTQTLTLCSNELPQDYLGTAITQPGTYTIHTPNAVGCDSIITLVVTVNPTPGDPTVFDKNLCGAGNTTLTVYAGQNGTTCRWYASENESTPFQTGTDYNNTFSESATFYVSSYNANSQCEGSRFPVTVTVNPVPGEPTVSNGSRCGAGEVVLTAEYGVNATLCRWYANSTSTTVQSEGDSYTMTFNNNQNTTKTIYVESYNATTGCKSTRLSVVATEYAVPAAPQVTNALNCGPLTTDLTHFVNTTADLYRWYDANEALLTEGAAFNTTVDASTTYFVSIYNNATGCESGKTSLSVTIMPTYDPQVIYDTTCQSRLYENHGISQTFNTTGEYDFVINEHTSTGCDSLVTLYLYVKPQVTYSFADESCDFYTWNNVVYDQSGVYTQTLTAANGCDSVVTLNLTIHHTVSTEWEHDTCTQYVWNNIMYIESGDYVQHFETANHCDSAVTLHLTIHPTYDEEFSILSCQYYDWNGITYEQTGDYTQNLQSVNGCDSIVTMHLTIHDTALVILKDAICSGYIYSENGFNVTFDEPDEYILTNVGQTIHDCDSTTILYLTVLPVFETEVYDTICHNGTYWFDNQELTEEGTFLTFLTAENGCDSLVILHLSVYPEHRNDVYAEVCRGESYEGYDFIVPEATVTHDYVRTNTDVNGCDSTTVLHLTVHQPATTDLYATLCLGDSYTENSFDFTADETGDFTEYLYAVTSFGCDSTVVLHVTVNPTSEVALTGETCQNEPYTLNSFNDVYDVPGQYTLTHHNQNVYGCDSTTTLTLTVYPTFETTVYDTVCFNEEYDFHGITLNTTGLYNTTLQSEHGCDSVIHLHLYVRPEKRRDITVDICEGAAYNAYDFMIPQATETQDYAHTVTDVSGCDSTTVLHLIVHEPVTTDLYATLCLHENYNQNGFQFTATETTTYTQNLHTFFGCDSTVNLHVTVNPTHHVVLQGQVCAGDTYTEHGFDTLFAQAGSYTLYHDDENVFGCDSVTELQLTVRPVYHQNIAKMICESGNYVFNGQTLTEAGVYTANLTSIYGCDSIVTLTLTVGEEFRDTIEAHVCYGNNYMQNGFEITNATATQYYERQYIDPNGCPATTVLHLIVHELNTTDLYATLCLGESYKLNGFNVTATKVGDTTHTRIVPTMYSCDSTVILHLTVNPVSTVSLADGVCAGIRYQQNGFDTLITVSGVYTLVNHDLNMYGCDSTTTMTLTVWPNMQTVIDTTICFNESYDFNGETLYAEGTYIDTLETFHGCDSIVTLHLSIYPENTYSFSEIACVSYTWNNTTYTESNDYIQHFTDIHGCDSTVTLHLTIHPASSSDTFAFACDSFDWYEHTGITQSTESLTHTFTNMFGCDSVVTLHLTVGHSNTGDTIALACNSFDWYEHTGITQSTETLTHTFTNASGCDSVVTLHLTVGHSNTGDTIAFACDSFDWYEHTGITQSTETLTHTFTNVSGCDSVVTLHLTVGHSNTADTFAFACDSFDWYEHTGITQSTETLTHTFTNVSGCDSVVTLHLTVGHSNTADTFAFACNSFDWYEHTGITQSTEALTHTFTNASGCDSVVTLHLTVGHSNTGDTIAFACDSFDWYEYTDITQSTETLTHTFTNASGCDSVVTLHLTVGHSNTGDTIAVACDSFDWYEHTGITQSTETLTHTFTNASGCDSVVTLHLTVNYSNTGDTNVVACDSFDWYELIGITQSTETLTHTFTNASGCDSVVTLHLTIHNSNDVHLYDTICLGNHYLANGFDTIPTVAGTYVIVNQTENIFECDSTTTLHLTVNPVSNVQYTATVCLGETLNLYGFDTLMTAAGVYTLVHEGQNIHGCDSVTTLMLTVNPTYSIDTVVNICDAELPFMWDDDQYWATGDYDILYSTVNQCDSIFHLHLNVHQTYSQEMAVTVCNGALPYYFDENHSYSAAGSYTINLQTVNGCDSIWHLQLTVTPNAEHTASATVCDSELPFVYDATHSFNAAGTYDITEADANNCLTITHFTLNVNPTYHHYDTVTVCEETLPYYYGTTPLNSTSDYDIHLNTVAGCDSLISVHFTVIPTAHSTHELYVCTNDFPMTYGDSTLTQAGVYNVTFQRDGLCDSIVTLTLHEAQEYLFTETDATCDHTLPYSWRGRELTQPGIYYDSLTSQHGCDSVYQLTLTVNETQLTVNNPIVLCSGETELWRGMTLSTAGTYRDTANNAITGCLEIYEVTVIVNPSYLFHDTVTICSDELPYQWHDMTLNSSGFREEYNQTVNLCDSIYRLTLIVNPSYHLTESITVCDYDLPYLWHNQSLTASGTYYDTLTTVSGCDSTITLTFTANPADYTTAADTICSSSLPYLWRGYSLTAGGTYYDTVQNAYGCDDVFELQLTVNAVSNVTIYDTVCQGDYYTLNGFDTLTSQAGTLYDQLTLTNAAGCDSIVTLILQVMPTYLFTTNAATCENVPYAWHGGEYAVAGDYYDSLVTASGCDSVFVLHLTLNPTFDVYVDSSIIANHEFVYDNFVFTPSDSGVFNYDIQYYTLAGCDSIVHLTLYVAMNIGVENFTMTPALSFYPNPTAATLNISGERMQTVEVFNSTGKLLNRVPADTPEFTQIDVTHYPTGHYLVKVVLDDGKTVTGKIVVNRQ